jgi:hypothetical protein
MLAPMMRQESGEAGAEAGAGDRSARIAALLVGVVVAVVFLPSLRNGLVNLDDDLYVYRAGEACESATGCIVQAFASFHPSGNWHPLTTLSHGLDRFLWGVQPFGHHLTSVVLHAINAGLLVLFGCAIARARAVVTGGHRTCTWGAVASALLWGLHPLRVESVAWVSERKDLLCGLFFLLACRSYLDYAMQADVNTSLGAFRQRGYRRALVFALLALLCKPMAVSLPFVLCVLDGYPAGRSWRARWRRLAIEKVPFLALACGAALLTMLAQRSIGAFRALADVPFTTRVLVALRSTALYLGKTVWPSALAPLSTYPTRAALLSWGTLAAVVVLAALVTVAFKRAGRAPGVLAATVAYLVMLAPVLGIVQVGPQAMADRYTYLPTIPLALLVGAAVHRGASRLRARILGRGSLVVAVGLVAGVFAWLSIRQISVWRDSGTLWSHVIRLEPRNMEAYNSRAAYFAEQGQLGKALADYDRALNLVPAVAPAHIDRRRAAIYNDRAIARFRLGQSMQAISDMTEAIRLAPNRADYFTNRGVLYRLIQQPEAARVDFQRARALREQPNAGVE